MANTTWLITTNSIYAPSDGKQHQQHLLTINLSTNAQYGF